MKKLSALLCGSVFALSLALPAFAQNATPPQESPKTERHERREARRDRRQARRERRQDRRQARRERRQDRRQGQEPPTPQR